MNVIAGCFLLPIGVVIYTVSGGSECVVQCQENDVNNFPYSQSNVSRVR